MVALEPVLSALGSTRSLLRIFGLLLFPPRCLPSQVMVWADHAEEEGTLGMLAEGAQ